MQLSPIIRHTHARVRKIGFCRNPVHFMRMRLDWTGPTAFLATGALDGATLEAMPSGVSTQNHLETLDQIIGRKKYSGMLDFTGTPPVLGYANSVTQTDLTIDKLKSEVGKNHSIFYILTHSTGTHVHRPNGFQVRARL